MISSFREKVEVKGRLRVLAQVGPLLFGESAHYSTVWTLALFSLKVIQRSNERWRKNELRLQSIIYGP